MKRYASRTPQAAFGGGQMSGNLVLPAAGSLSWLGRSKAASSANGLLELTNNAGTQGARLDLTVDSKLTLTDEAGGNLRFIVNGIDVSGSYISVNGSVLLYNDIGTTIGLYTSASSGAAATKFIELASGAQTNAGNYDSGEVRVYSGATTTDGNTGNIKIYSGVAGAGQADAGDIILAVHGAPGTGKTVLTCKGATGAAAFGVSAATLGPGVTTFAVTSNTMTMTGDAAGNTVATITGGVAGMQLVLIFVDNKIIITDTAIAGLAANQAALSGAFTSAAGTTLHLVHNGTGWLELSRSANG